MVPGKRVLVGDQGIPGVIGIQPIHLSKSEEREKTLPFDQLAVDIGCLQPRECLGPYRLRGYGHPLPRCLISAAAW